MLTVPVPISARSKTPPWKEYVAQIYLPYLPLFASLCYWLPQYSLWLRERCKKKGGKLTIVSFAFTQSHTYNLVFFQSVISQSVFSKSIFSQSVFPQILFFQIVFSQSVFSQSVYPPKCIYPKCIFCEMCLLSFASLYFCTFS